jgi:hypothetical protein
MEVVSSVDGVDEPRLLSLFHENFDRSNKCNHIESL